MNTKIKLIGALFAIIIGCFIGYLSLAETSETSVTKPPSQTQVASQTQTQSTGWQRRCIDAEQKQCEIFQSISIGSQENNMRLSEVAVSKSSSEDIALGVTLPLGITLTQGLGLQVDDGQMMQMPFQNCHTNGCSAVSKITPEILSEFQNGATLGVYFFDGANQRVKVDLSLDGFTQTLKTL